MSTPDGLVVVDKPAGWTSHDVVARLRRLAQTRRVGHAGTLDPMATGVLLLGIGRATRLLGHLAGTGKAYRARVRLGVITDTDDADGAVLSTAPTGAVTEQRVRVALTGLRGTIEQVPPAYSAVHVAGRRAYARARAGQPVRPAARRVHVTRLELLAVRLGDDLAEVELDLDCSTGTYVRSLARDLGAALGVGGHLTALRRTAVGPFPLADARTPDQLAEQLAVLPMAAAARAVFPTRVVDAAQAWVVGHGGALPPIGLGPGPTAVISPDDTLLALVEERGEQARPLAVFVP